MKTLIFIIMTLLAAPVLADEIVTTRSGKKVILNDNHTWEYWNKSQQKGQTIYEQINDFTDNPTIYKGKKIKARLMYIDRRYPDLRAGQGNDLKFRADNYIMINVPKSITVPNVTFYEMLIITFISKDGRTDSGNVATEIIREQ